MLSPKSHLHSREAPVLRSLQKAEGVFQGSPHLTCKIKQQEWKSGWPGVRCQRGSCAPQELEFPQETQAGRRKLAGVGTEEELVWGAGLSHRPEELSNHLRDRS